jgi:hypothetical protein
MMRMALSAVVLAILSGTALAESATGFKARLRVADAAADACFASCADQSASCKRVCPTTFSTPCLSGCDAQAQTCRQSCQNR